MRKKFYFIPFIIFTVIISENYLADAQAGWWTWISGSNMSGTAAVYGTQGVPSTLNHPGGAYEQTQWKDKQGNFWLYGGMYPDLDDLWKYNPVTNEWTWVRGTGTAGVLPTYGIMGVPDPANQPGSRRYGTAAWTDTTGNLWLFGGLGVSMYNDMWKYNVLTNEWTWVRGSNTIGSHGILGVPSILNDPGGRTEAYANWADANNNLWLFGGSGFDDAGQSGMLNDLCSYNISTNEWTWMKGSKLMAFAPHYGTLGISSPSNDPGGRFSTGTWKDLQGNLWLFGGDCIGNRNDMWKFDPLINEWTWIAGPTTTDDVGNYQVQCSFNQANYPAARRENRASVNDNCGSFWMFGGMVLPGVINDLCVFNPDLKQWNWVSGSGQPNQQGNWGALGIPAATNIPSARTSGVAWWGNDNKFYMFGGPDFSHVFFFNDLWVYEPDTACMPNFCLIPVAMFTAPNNICPGVCVDFTNLSSHSTSFQWIFNGSTIGTSTDANPQSVCYNTPGTYDVTLIAYNSLNTDTLTLQNYITVFPSPSSQAITQSGDTLFANTGAAGYQWYLNGSLIAGATDYYYVANITGNYNIVATDINGCEVEAAIFNVEANLSSVFTEGEEILVFPNPVGDKLVIHSGRFNIKTISIYNILCEAVLVIPPGTLGGEHSDEVDVSALARGMYWVEVNTDKNISRARLIKQ